MTVSLHNLSWNRRHHSLPSIVFCVDMPSNYNAVNQKIYHIWALNTKSNRCTVSLKMLNISTIIEVPSITWYVNCFFNGTPCGILEFSCFSNAWHISNDYTQNMTFLQWDLKVHMWMRTRHVKFCYIVKAGDVPYPSKVRVRY